MEIVNKIRVIRRALCTRLTALWQKPANTYYRHQTSFAGKTGIEIGGPSQVFSRNGIFPVYPVVQHLDNCNFSAQTVWAGSLQAGTKFVFDKHKPAGEQFIAEATNLDFLPASHYDFLLSSHVLEHIANPIRALQQWIRLLKVEGTLVLILPDRKKTFDHMRPVTHISHLIEDYENNVAEDDLTHLPEILSLHDLSRDPEAGSREAFKARGLKNKENRCLHHHVFDIRLAIELVEYVGLRVESVEEARPHHLLILGRKFY